MSHVLDLINFNLTVVYLPDISPTVLNNWLSINLLSSFGHSILKICIDFICQYNLLQNTPKQISWAHLKYISCNRKPARALYLYMVAINISTTLICNYGNLKYATRNYNKYSAWCIQLQKQTSVQPQAPRALTVNITNHVNANRSFLNCY